MPAEAIANMETKEVDVLVLGGGMAGHRAAVAAAQSGCTVGHAFLARGASSFMICANVPLGSVDPRDNPDVYAQDMVRGGYAINDRRLVDVMAANAIPSFEDLVSLGVPFVREGSGYAQRLLAGNSYPRGVYTSTGGMGPVIMDTLSKAGAAAGVQAWPASYVIGLLRDQEGVSGALMADYRKGTLWVGRAKTVVLAMGGIGRLYEASTYPADVSSDSYAIALEAGATLIDMEFVQFEPTVTVFPEGARGMEMPTAMLGDGAQLLNALGERFMFRHNPVHGERLIEKARMSFCIQQEIDEGRGLPDGTVYFNTSTVPAERLESYVSHCKRLRNSGLEPTKEMPRVRPAAHSQMGGVKIDATGFTGIPGLFACGETSGGVHGASRMAGNSGAETLIMGWVVGRAAAAAARRSQSRAASSLSTQPILDDLFGGRPSADDVMDVRKEAGQIMVEKAGLYRDEVKLKEGLASIRVLQSKTAELTGGSFRQAIDWRTTRNMLRVGAVILEAALSRTESRGAHRRTDFPQQDDDRWLKHVALHPTTDKTGFSVGLADIL
jgi:succinate dehydrogenase/fumarate reductase flavoprotein subunit